MRLNSTYAFFDDTSCFSIVLVMLSPNKIYLMSIYIGCNTLLFFQHLLYYVTKMSLAVAHSPQIWTLADAVLQYNNIIIRNKETDNFCNWYSMLKSGSFSWYISLFRTIFEEAQAGVALFLKLYLELRVATAGNNQW